MAYGQKRWSPRRLLLHVSQLPADSRTVRALAGAVPGMDLDQQLLLIVSHKMDLWAWQYQMMHSDPESKDSKARSAAKELKEARPRLPEIQRAPGWVGDGGRIRTPEEMERLRKEADEARKSETSDNQVKPKAANGTVQDWANAMAGG